MKVSYILCSGLRNEPQVGEKGRGNEENAKS